ncbi:MAG: restriction endonuclease subunit S [Pirellula sp.]
MASKATNLKPKPSRMSTRASWPKVRFGDVVRDVKGSVDRETTDLTRFIAGEHMGSEDLHLRTWGDINGDYLGPAFHRSFRKGQVLYGSRRTYLKKIAVASFDGICANTTFVLESHDPGVLLPELLPFVMLTDAFTQHSIRESKGSINPYINWKDIAKYEFSLPPKDEQRRIADILWAVDEAIELHKAGSLKASALLEAMRQDIFRQHLKIGTTSPLSDVGQWRSGGTPSRSNVDFWGGDFPWVSPKDMKVSEIQNSEEHLTPEGKSEASIVPCNAILFVIRGMILAHTFPVAITRREVAFNQDMKAIIANDAFDPLYVYHWLQSHSMTILGMVADSSHGTKRLPIESLLSLRIPVPDRKTQGEAVRLFQQAVEASLRLKDHADSLRELKSRLMNELLAPGGTV